ncbi:MAG: DNA repair protein RecO [Armatimonadota bacterium]
MPLYTVNAIILRRINFGETDRIVTMYTREKGKISGIAKGARKAITRLAGATEVITYGRYQLASGKNLDIFAQVEVRDSFPRIHCDLYRIAHATYMAEIIDKFVEEDEENPDLFDLLLSSLYLMDRDNDPEMISRMFELQFMRDIGYEPVLDKCLRCLKPLESGQLSFSPSLGGVVCRECGHLPEDAINISREAVDTMQRLLNADAHEVESMEVSREVLDQIARVMRWYIRYRAERDLKSADFLQTLRLGRDYEKPDNCQDIR